MTDQKKCAALIISSVSSLKKDFIRELRQNSFDDIIIINDTGMDITDYLPEDIEGLKQIYHEEPQGYGISFIHLIEYARDYNYSWLFCFNERISSLSEKIKTIQEQLDYGYDIICCSRILENYDYGKISEKYVKVNENICQRLRELTNLDLTDPMSGTLAINMNSISSIEFTEDSPAVLLQLFIQAAINELAIHEIPCPETDFYGTELSCFEEPLDYCLALIETEYILHRKGTVN